MTSKSKTSSSSERLLIKPSNPQESKTTLKQIKDTVDVINLGIGVNRVKSQHDGKIIIDVEKEADKNIITNEIKNKLGNLYEIKELNKKLPKLKVIGVEKNLINMDEAKFIDNLIKQNEFSITEPSTKLIKIVKKFSTKKNYGSIILEVCPTIHNILVQNGNVKTGWKNYKVYNYINVIRCFNCWGFNHFASKCSKAETCRLCSGKHNEKACNNDFVKCINCSDLINKFKLKDWDDKHCATDRSCGCYLKMTKNEQMNINYNEK